MSQIVAQALILWGMPDAAFVLIAARENQVFRVDHAGSSYALRLHRSGYRTDTELRSELQWMDAVAQGGLFVPAPIPSASNEFLHVVEGTQIDMLTWLEGDPVGATGEDLQSADRDGLFRQIGHEMARLHAVSDSWVQPVGFVRCAWDRSGLVGDNPLWGRFWENPTLSASDRGLFVAVRQRADADLAAIESALDYGLIHADLVRENVMIDGDKLQLIDFDDGGFGFRLFDLATTLLKNMNESDYAALRESLTEGYRSVRPIDTRALDLFLLLRAATYVGWIAPRLNEDGSEVRNARFVEQLRQLALNYLDR